MNSKSKYNVIKVSTASLVYLGCTIIRILTWYGFIPNLIDNIPYVTNILSIVSFLSVLFLISYSKNQFFAAILFIQTANIVLMLTEIARTENSNLMFSVILAVHNLIAYIILTRCVWKLEINERKVKQLACTDSLTGLLNRTGMIKKLEDKISQKKSFYFAILDLNDFRCINDIININDGDDILKTLTVKWAQLNVDCKLAYFGEGTFAILYEADKNDMDNLAHQILQNIYDISIDKNINLSVDIGISQYPANGDSIDKLLAFADSAMMQSKESGKNHVTYFDFESYKIIAKKYIMERTIKEALTKDLFEIYYQPQFSLVDHKLVGLEALLRLKDKSGKYMNTQDIIRIAEKSRLIYDIDLWIIENVMLQMSGFITINPDVEISLNIYGSHIIMPGFVEHILKCMEAYNFNPTCLKLEITESSYLDNFDDIKKTLSKIKSLGVKIALDDFGTGYSSISYLMGLPVDAIKIDKSFINDLEVDGTKHNFVDAIIKMGHSLNNKVVAEGVEKEEQLDILSDLNCDYIQGFIWGKPIPKSEILKLAKKDL